MEKCVAINKTIDCVNTRHIFPIHKLSAKRLDKKRARERKKNSHKQYPKAATQWSDVMDLASGRQPVYAFFFSCRLFPCQSELRGSWASTKQRDPHSGETVCRARARGLIMPMLLITAAAAYFVDAGCSPLKKSTDCAEGGKT